MKQFKLLLLAACMLFTIAIATSCHQVIGAREVGVEVHNWGSNKGVDQTPYTTGWNWYGPGTDMIVYPIHEVNYLWTRDSKDGDATKDESFDFAIKGGTGVNLDLGIEFSIDSKKAWVVYSRYSYDVEGLKNVVLRKAVMNSLVEHGKDYTIDEFVDGGIVALIDSVNKDVISQFKPDGIDVTKISMLNKPRYSTTVTNAIESKIEATQNAIRVQNEVQSTRAQATKDSVEAVGHANAKKAEADGIAYYNEKSQEHLTPLLIEMEKIKAWKESGGKVPTYYSGSGGNMFSIPMDK
jgi:regulator of protease activity HflC (stomatin/prohibitin superfamily)